MLMKCTMLATMLLAMTASSPVLAGNWHVESSLHCPECHVQHATQDRQPLPGGPFVYLLTKGSVNELCLSCHDGSDPEAPDVLAPVEMYSPTGTGESAAGMLAQAGFDNSFGHNLDFPAFVPYQAAGDQLALNCASCHDVHGNANYRNLLSDPARTGMQLVVREGFEVFTQFRPDNPPTPTGSIRAYAQDNVGYQSGLSDWCASCHDRLAANSPGTDPAHFLAHPAGVTMNEFVGENHTDLDHWLGGTGDGFAPDDPEGIGRLPVENVDAVDFSSAVTVKGSNRLFCGSCHRAHGGYLVEGLRWPYREGGSGALAGCQQCHYK